MRLAAGFSNARITRPMFFACLAMLSLACADRATAPLLEPVSPRASVALEGDIRPDTVLNRYVVVLHDNVPSAAAASASLVAAVGGLRFYVYEIALKGFAVANLPAGAAEALRRSPLVKSVEEDNVMMPLQAVQNFTFPVDTGLYLLDRIDQRNLPLDWQYSYFHTGWGSHLYVIDSGVRGGHQEWGYGRIGNSAAFIKWSIDPSPTIDQLGHGTAVAGAAAGSRVGVAKLATIHSVRIDDGGGGAHVSDIVAGLDWVAAYRTLPAVANLSYGNDSDAIATAVSGVVRQGVTFVTAAGNSGVDACNPTTQVASVLTVGSTVVSDYRAGYSNYGPCVDIFAPGGDLGGYQYGFGLVELASNEDNTAYRTSRGTSFASPVVAGVAALVLQQSAGLSPAQVADLILQSATTNVVLNPGFGSPNRFLYSQVYVPSPPSPLTSVSISGPTQIEPGATCTWYANVSDGTAPYGYQWTNNDAPVGTSYYYTGSKDPGSFASSFRVKVVVTDAGGRQGSYEITVYEDSSAGLCQT